MFQVEFTPCLYPRECWSLMLEMMQTLIGDQAPSSLPTAIINKPDISLPELMTIQYVEMFNNIRKANLSR